MEFADIVHLHLRENNINCHIQPYVPVPQALTNLKEPNSKGIPLPPYGEKIKAVQIGITAETSIQIMLHPDIGMVILKWRRPFSRKDRRLMAPLDSAYANRNRRRWAPDYVDFCEELCSIYDNQFLDKLVVKIYEISKIQGVAPETRLCLNKLS